MYNVIRKGRTIYNNTTIVHSYEDIEDAKAAAKRMRADLTPGEKKYFKIQYRVVPITRAINE